MFYRFLYALPYLSTIRNPIKFMHPFHIAWLILAAYGMEALWRRYLQSAARRTDPLFLHFQRWWGTASGFEKKWVAASAALIGIAGVALFVFSGSKPRLIQYLTQNALDETRAIQTADFSVAQARWFIVWLLAAAGVIAGILSGAWSGPQSRLAWVLVGSIIIIDQVRSDAPWIHYFNFQRDYAGDSVVDFLQDQPYEHRVTGRLSPKGPGSSVFTLMGRLYDFWQQNNFPLHGIQSLDVAQWPRMPSLDAAYLKNFALTGDDATHADLWPSERLWELTNTRYLVGPAPLAPLINRHADARHAIQVKTFLQVMKKTDVTTVEEFGDMTAVPEGNGPFALMEIPNPLPRAKLYAHWQSPTNDAATLKTLLSHDFDPEQTVLVAPDTPVAQAPGDPKLEPGTVSITDYQPKRVSLQANVTAPAVLLLNDRIAPAWKVRVDQKPAALLRCNYLMRGVFLAPGEHTVQFRFQPPLTALYLSLCGWGIGILTAGYLVYTRKPTPTPAPAPVPQPVPVSLQKPAPAQQAEIAGRSRRARRK
jgi:hypothetical protein